MAEDNALRRLLEAEDEEENRIGGLLPAAVVKNPYADGFGIAFLLTAHLSEKWRAGNILVFWPNGDVTVEDGLAEDESDILVADLWSYLRERLTAP